MKTLLRILTALTIGVLLSPYVSAEEKSTTIWHNSEDLDSWSKPSGNNLHRPPQRELISDGVEYTVEWLAENSFVTTYRKVNDFSLNDYRQVNVRFKCPKDTQFNLRFFYEGDDVAKGAKKEQFITVLVTSKPTGEWEEKKVMLPSREISVTRVALLFDWNKETGEHKFCIGPLIFVPREVTLGENSTANVALAKYGARGYGGYRDAFALVDGVDEFSGVTGFAAVREPNYLYVDLPQPKSISVVRILFAHGEYHYKLEGSTDSNKQNWKLLFEGDSTVWVEHSLEDKPILKTIRITGRPKQIKDPSAPHPLSIASIELWSPYGVRYREQTPHVTPVKQENIHDLRFGNITYKINFKTLKILSVKDTSRNREYLEHPHELFYVAKNTNLPSEEATLPFSRSDEFTVDQISERTEGKLRIINVKASSSRLAVTALLTSRVAEDFIDWSLHIENNGVPSNFYIIFPQWFINFGNCSYLYPWREGIISRASRIWNTLYSGENMFQLMDVFEHGKGGFCMFPVTGQDLNKRLCLDKNENVKLSCSYEVYLKKNESFSCPTFRTLFHSGDWFAAVQIYSQFAHTWWKTPVHPAWQNRISVGERFHGDFRQLPERFSKTKALYGGADLFWLDNYFDKGYFEGKGDYRINSNWGSANGLSEVIRKLKQQGVRTSLYLEAFIAHENSDIVKRVSNKWSIRSEDGTILSQYPNNQHLCPASDEWRKYLSDTCARVIQETDADEIYLDSLGLHNHPCFHVDHPIGNSFEGPVAALFRNVRESIRKIKPDVSLSGEGLGGEVASQYLDSAFVSTPIFIALREFEYSLPYVPLRFIYPEIKYRMYYNPRKVMPDIIQLCAFNGIELFLPQDIEKNEAILGEVSKIARAYRLFGDALFGKNVKPVKTDVEGVYGNQFVSDRLEVITFYNIKDRPVTYQWILPSGKHACNLKTLDKIPAQQQNGKQELEITIAPRHTFMLGAFSNEKDLDFNLGIAQLGRLISF